MHAHVFIQMNPHSSSFFCSMLQGTEPGGSGLRGGHCNVTRIWLGLGPQSRARTSHVQLHACGNACRKYCMHGITHAYRGSSHLTGHQHAHLSLSLDGDQVGHLGGAFDQEVHAANPPGRPMWFGGGAPPPLRYRLSGCCFGGCASGTTPAAMALAGYSPPATVRATSEWEAFCHRNSVTLVALNCLSWGMSSVLQEFKLILAKPK